MYKPLKIISVALLSLLFISAAINAQKEYKYTATLSDGTKIEMVAIVNDEGDAVVTSVSELPDESNKVTILEAYLVGFMQGCQASIPKQYWSQCNQPFATEVNLDEQTQANLAIAVNSALESIALDPVSLDTYQEETLKILEMLDGRYAEWMSAWLTESSAVPEATVPTSTTRAIKTPLPTITPRPTNTPSPTATPTPTEIANLSSEEIEQLIKTAPTLSYDEMLRRYRQYEGEIVHMRGIITSIENPDSNYVPHRLAIISDGTDWGDKDDFSIIAGYSGQERLMIRDSIDIWGVLKGVENDVYGPHPVLETLHLELFGLDPSVAEQCKSQSGIPLQLTPMDIVHFFEDCAGATVSITGIVEDSNPQTGQFVLKTYNYGYWDKSDEVIALYSGEEFVLDGDEITITGMIDDELVLSEYLGGHFSARPFITVTTYEFVE